MQWFILKVGANKRAEAIEKLEGWYPRYDVRTKPSGKRKPVVSKRPLFPGWILVRYSGSRYRLSKDYGKVIKYGVHGPLMLREEDMDLIEEIIIELSDWEGVSKLREEEAEDIRIGDYVEVPTLGGLKGQVTEFFSDGSAKLATDAPFAVRVLRCLLRKSSVKVT